MRNPNTVTKTTSTTSESFITRFEFASARIASANVSEFQTTFAQVSGSTVVQVGRVIVVTQPIWKPE